MRLHASVFVIVAALLFAAAPLWAQQPAPATQPAPAPAVAPAPLPPPPPPPPPPAVEKPAKPGEHCCKKPPVQVTPYGLLVTNFFWALDPVNNIDVPTMASAADPAGLPSKGHAFGATVRQSRVGLLAKAPVLASAIGATSVDALVEIDFYGSYIPGSNVSYYMPLPRLRLFNLGVAWGGFKVVAGQDWSIFAPLNPDSLNHVAVPSMSSTGNLWMRYPQVRGEYKYGPVGVTVGVLAPADARSDSTDPITNTRTAQAGEQLSAPSVEGRLFVATKLLGETVSAGFSGHYGRENWPDPVAPATGPKSLPIWGTALDINLPLGKMFALKAEGYFGANLDGFFSSASILGRPGGDQKPVPTKGGWVQASFKPGNFGLHLAAGRDDPEPPDDSYYFADKAVDSNTAIYVAATYAFAHKFVVGLEYDWLRTKRVGATKDMYRNTANYVNLTMSFGF